MPRKYQPMSKEEFENDLWTALEALDERGHITRAKMEREHPGEALTWGMYASHVFDIAPQSDWNINHDHENLTCSPGEFRDGGGKLMGIQQMGDFCFLGCLAGGDWEMPIFFMIYFEAKGKTRVYIPKKGNVFCPKHKCAWGSCDDVGEEGGCGYSADHDEEWDWEVLKGAIKKRFALL